MNIENATNLIGQEVEWESWDSPLRCGTVIAVLPITDRFPDPRAVIHVDTVHTFIVELDDFTKLNIV